jgi:hypothetical protein
MSFFRIPEKANFQKLQLSLILTVAGKIWGILQISAVICRILQIPRGSGKSKPKFHSKKLAKGGRANLGNPTNFSGNLPDSPDSTRFRKF